MYTNMKKTIPFLLLIGWLLIGCTSSRIDKLPSVKVTVSPVAFYNVENLFDTINQPGVNDYEYTPEGPMRWNTMRYTAKLERMSYAISQIALDHSPIGAVIVGLCEVENRGVLEDLVAQPTLKDRSYEIVHYDGPDRRGVDVALLYNPAHFIVSNSKSHRLHSPDTSFRTRDQLLVSGYLQDEKIHVIVNHWPSRFGGELRSRPRRMEAAALTRSIVDSLFRIEPQARIIVMGDLNDDPHNESVANVLRAKENKKDVGPGGLYNVFWKMHRRGIGSLAYNDQWNMFDQIILSHELIHPGKNKLYLWKSEVFNPSFLIQQEGPSKGTPLRTHSGGAWLNGYSDHFPTLVYLIKEQ